MIYDRNNFIYICFPGVGKTTYALHNAGAIDLDFGNFRSAMKYSKDREHELYVPFSRLMKYYFRDGYNVLTNEPGLMPLVKQFANDNVVVELPIDNSALVQRVEEREKLRHVNADFPKQLKQNINKWVEDWESCAKRYDIPVFKVDYFKEVQHDSK